MKTLFSTLLLFFLCLFPAIAQKSPEQVIREMETKLLPALIPGGDTVLPMSLAERMAFHKVPGLSIAYFENGKIQWTRCYGFRDSARTLPVDTTTLFQAASISKPVAATGALLLVESGKLALDQPVNAYLKSWKVPENRFTQDSAVTLRRLLTHSAGLTVHGFRGYARNEAIPTAIQVLQGEKPSNSAAILPDTLPGAIWRYSGGGYTVMQQLVEDVGKQPFADYSAAKVLRPAGMMHSTFQQPLPKDRHSRASVGFRENGQPVEGLWHSYPEQAAAGLWTTPADLARWAIQIQEAFNGATGKVLKPATARQMLVSHFGRHGLGPGVNGEGEKLSFGHGGANEGFRCQLFAFAKKGGAGVAIMTNSDSGSRLVRELLNSIDRSYGWNNFKADTIPLVKLSSEQLDRFAGEYSDGQQLQIRLERKGDRLLAHALWDGSMLELRPVSESRFFSFEEGFPVRFELSAEGSVEKMIVANSLTMTRKKD